MKNAMCLTVALMALVSLGEVEFSDVLIRQRWPWSTKIDVSYLAKGVSDYVGVKPVFKVGGVELSYLKTSLSGDCAISRDGFYHITWDPEAAGLEVTTLKQLSVTLQAVEVPLYLIVDLTKKKGNDGQLTWVWEDDLRAGRWGEWVENPYDYIRSVSWTGVATNDTYRTNSLVLRYVAPTTAESWTSQHAGVDTFVMGAPGDVTKGTARTEGKADVEAHIYEMSAPQDAQPQMNVRLRKGYWMGVFEVTQGQWDLLKPETNVSVWVSSVAKLRPVDLFKLELVRGAQSSYPWSEAGHRVDANSFFGRLCARTGLTFDLPTEAQWEFAARAGATGLRYCAPTYEGVSASSRCWWKRWGYKPSESVDPSSSGTQVVGCYVPNAWGLYDVLGNVAEACLNSFVSPYNEAIDGGDDPVGSTDKANGNVFRGGEYYNYIQYSTLPGRRWAGGDAGNYHYEGFRAAMQ